MVNKITFGTIPKLEPDNNTKKTKKESVVADNSMPKELAPAKDVFQKEKCTVSLGGGLDYVMFGGEPPKCLEPSNPINTLKVIFKSLKDANLEREKEQRNWETFKKENSGKCIVPLAESLDYLMFGGEEPKCIDIE